MALFFVTAFSAMAEAADVTIHRDKWGVPHIYADREEYGFYGLGYSHGEDDLIRLLGGFNWVKGRQAALQGKGKIDADIEVRRWMHVEEGRWRVRKYRQQHPTVMMTIVHSCPKPL